MQKRILTFVLTLACLAMATAALAETFTGGNVTVEVPDGWTTMYNAPTMQALVASPSQECVSSIQLMPTNGKSAEQLAQMLSEQLGGSAPEKTSNGAYFFTANSSGVPMEISVAAEGNKALVFMEIGDKGSYKDELDVIRMSMKSNDSVEQGLLDAMK